MLYSSRNKKLQFAHEIFYIIDFFNNVTGIVLNRQNEIMTSANYKRTLGHVWTFFVN